MTLATNSDAIRPQTRSGCCWNSKGPGVMLYSDSAPIITAIGVYAVHATTFDLFLMVGIGIFGYILRKLDFPLSPILLGFILGGLMEQNLRRALSISNGSLEILWSSPITLGVWMLTVIMLAFPLLRIWRKRSQRRALADV